MVTQNSPTFIVCTPHDLYFAAEVELQLINFRKFGYTKGMYILVYEDDKEEKEGFKGYWIKLQERYTEVTFTYYSNPNLKQLQKSYPQICRPFMLAELWKTYPELKNRYIMYIDSDVLFTKPLIWEDYLQDGTCYMSKTDYIGYEYFASKRKDVMFHKKQEYDRLDILGKLSQIVGVDKQVVQDNEVYTGGCQYLLTGIDAQFWEDVMKHSIEIRLYTLAINQEYFISEEKGLQSWCADMWALLWNLWKRGIKTECPASLDFSWASSPIARYNDCAIFHNAGISGKIQEIAGKKERVFYKGDIRFRTSSITFFDISDYGVLSQDYCSKMYVQAIQEVKDPICVTESYIY